MTVEQWAQQIIEKELNGRVVVHDDGRQPSLNDLRIGALEAPEVAIESLLRDLEKRDIRRVSEGILFKRHDDLLLQKLESLGIQNASCVRMPGAGQVHWTMEGSGGAIDSEGSALPQWIEEFLRDSEREDVLRKLRHTGAQERWVFVPVALGGTPFSVESYLMGEFECLPATGPNLPAPVTGIWVASTHGTHGVRWDSAGWRLVRISDHSS